MLSEINTMYAGIGSVAEKALEGKKLPTKKG
jgi:hypothetical protein